MMDFDDFGGPLTGKPLSQADKAAAVLLAMGKGVAGKLLKYFTQAELETIIASAQTLRTIPPDELTELVNEFEDLFTEGAGLMDNAKAIESILEEGLTPEEVDGLLGTFEADEPAAELHIENVLLTGDAERDVLDRRHHECGLWPVQLNGLGRNTGGRSDFRQSGPGITLGCEEFRRSGDDALPGQLGLLTT